jgi:hypothetical protein
MGTTEPAVKDLSIYPNPLGERLVVEIPEDAGVCSLSIYNPNGQVILFREMCKAKAVVDVSHFGPGVYFLQVKNSKFIKNCRLLKL